MANPIGFSKRHAVVVAMMLLIALVHIFRVGSYLTGVMFQLYYSYFSDVVIPFGCYFLWCLSEEALPILRPWPAKSALAFLLPCAAETLQGFGVPVLGSTFDPLDYVMYAVGSMSAALVETQVFPRLFGFWTIQRAAG